MRVVFPVLVILLLALAACSDDNGKTPDQGPADQGPAACTAKAQLPANGAVGDFNQQKAPDLAANLTDLTALIDGGSEKYTQGGKFVCMAWVKYASGTKAHTLEAWLFDQTDASGAEGAYTNTKNPDDQNLSPVIGDAARGHENAISDIYQADMRKGQYLIRVIADKVAGKDDAVAMLIAIAGIIK